MLIAHTLHYQEEDESPTNMNNERLLLSSILSFSLV
jgi:hypothetical protein